MTILYVLIFLALLATVIVMAMGLMFMSGNRPMDRALSTKFMWARVILQGLTVVLLIVALVLL